MDALAYVYAYALIHIHAHAHIHMHAHFTIANLMSVEANRYVHVYLCCVTVCMCTLHCALSVHACVYL